MCSWTRFTDAKLIKNISNFLVVLLRFCFRRTTWKAQFSGVFLPLRNPFVASFNETRPPTSRKNLVEEGIVMPNWPKTFQTFWWHSYPFALEKQPKNLNFQIFYTPNSLTDHLVATFNEKRAPTSREYVAQQGIVIPNWSKIFQTFLLHSSDFPLKKEPKNLNFQSFFTSKKPFGG